MVRILSPQQLKGFITPTLSQRKVLHFGPRPLWLENEHQRLPLKIPLPQTIIELSAPNVSTNVGVFKDSSTSGWHNLSNTNETFTTVKMDSSSALVMRDNGSNSTVVAR